MNKQMAVADNSAGVLAAWEAWKPGKHVCEGHYSWGGWEAKQEGIHVIVCDMGWNCYTYACRPSVSGIMEEGSLSVASKALRQTTSDDDSDIVLGKHCPRHSLWAWHGVSVTEEPGRWNPCVWLFQPLLCVMCHVGKAWKSSLVSIIILWKRDDLWWCLGNNDSLNMASPMPVGRLCGRHWTWCVWHPVPAY